MARAMRPRSRLWRDERFPRSDRRCHHRRYPGTGTYRKRTKGGYRARITGTFAGQRDPATDRSTGTWAVKVMVTRKGKVVDRCALKRVTWTAK